MIANTLYLSEDIEKWGSGLRRIHDECEKNNVKVKFNVMKYGFSIVFERDIKDLVNAPTKDTEKDTVKDGVKLNKNQEQIINLMKTKSTITIEELSKEIGITT